MKPCPYSAAHVLPHAHPMILIDGIVGYDETSLTSTITVHPGAQFFRAGRGIPAHIALEWMAQTCGAYAGARALDDGGSVQTGLLLGTRDFDASIAWFTDGQRVNVNARQLFNDGSIGSFDCTLTDPTSDLTLATATLTVYQLAADETVAQMKPAGAAP